MMKAVPQVQGVSSKVWVFRILALISGVSLIYSGIYGFFLPTSRPVDTSLVGLVTLPRYAYRIVAWESLGIIFILLGARPRLLRSFIYEGRKPHWLALRIALVAIGITELNPALLSFPGNFISSRLSPLNPAVASGLLFPAGIFFHFLLQHLFGGAVATGMGLYPKIFKPLVPPPAIPVEAKVPVAEPAVVPPAKKGAQA